MKIQLTALALAALALGTMAFAEDKGKGGGGTTGGTGSGGTGTGGTGSGGTGTGGTGSGGKGDGGKGGGTVPPAPVTISDPEILFLKSCLATTDKFKEPKVLLALARSVDSNGKAIYDGNFSFNFHHVSAPLNYEFTMKSITSFSDANGEVDFAGTGSMYNPQSKSSMDVKFEVRLQDNLNSSSAAGAVPDLFAIHFWRDKSDFNSSAVWNPAAFKSVEIYRP